MIKITFDQFSLNFYYFMNIFPIKSASRCKMSQY